MELGEPYMDNHREHLEAEIERVATELEAASKKLRELSTLKEKLSPELERLKVWMVSSATRRPSAVFAFRIRQCLVQLFFVESAAVLKGRAAIICAAFPTLSPLFNTLFRHIDGKREHRHRFHHRMVIDPQCACSRRQIRSSLTSPPVPTKSRVFLPRNHARHPSPRI